MAVANVPSSLLSAEENDLLFTLVGARKQTRTTTPVEVLERLSGAVEWTTVCGNGVACFVKDNVKKSYFIRVFNLDSKACIFELDALTSDAGMLKSSDLVFEEGDPCTLTFPAKYIFTLDKKMMFRFRDATEAKSFVEFIREKLEATKTRRQTPQSRQPPLPPPGRYSSNPPSPPSSAQSSSRSSSTSSESSNLSLFGRVKRKPKPKINKADIGRPADLRHMGHVGYDPSTGAFDSSSVAPEWRKLLDTIGVSDEQLKDKDTASFIYDFVERHGGIAEANRQLQKKPPPPPPSRSRVVDPPPPPNRGRSGDSSPPPPLPARGRTPSGSSPPPPPPPPSRSRVVDPPPPPNRGRSGDSSPPPPLPARGRTPSGSSPPPPPPPTRRDSSPPPPTRRDSSPPPPTRRDSSPPPPPPTRRDSSPPPPPVPARVRTPSGSSPPSRASQHLQGSSPPPSPPRRISSARGLRGKPVEVELSELDFGESLGIGSFGVVRKCIWRSKLYAVKQMQLGHVTDPEKEVELLSSLDHPNIIKLYAKSVDVHNLFCIIEFAENGSIRKYIEKKLGQPDLKTSLRWAIEIAEGMNYLHEKDLVHRDLKSDNVLLTADWTAKICDFGTARMMDHTTKGTTSGTYAWMAPEVIKSEKYSKSCDVYSYGVVLWELVTHGEPYPDEFPLRIVMIVVNGVRPEIPAALDEDLAGLIELCWQESIPGRPDFKKVLDTLKSVNIE